MSKASRRLSGAPILRVESHGSSGDPLRFRNEKLTPADPADLADAIAFALRYSGRKRVNQADEYMTSGLPWAWTCPSRPVTAADLAEFSCRENARVASLAR
jgi:hypothetical protein